MDLKTKSQAIQLFGSQAKLARALGISNQAVNQWADELPQDRIDWIMGAALRLGYLAVDQEQNRAA